MPGEPAASQSDKISARLLYTAPKTGTINAVRKTGSERNLMTLNFYTLGVIYLVYSFLGWVAETVVATIRGGRFANRGAAAGPFCFIYGTTGVLLAVSFGDLRAEPVYLFFAHSIEEQPAA